MNASDQRVPLYVKKAQDGKSPHLMMLRFVRRAMPVHSEALRIFEEIAQIGEMEPRAVTTSPGHAPIQTQLTRATYYRWQ